MTGMASAAAGAMSAAQTKPYVVGAAESGGTAWLYLRGSTGSLGPTDTFKGNNIQRIQSSTTVPFRLEIAPQNLAQSFFRYLIVKKSDGSFVRLPSSGTGVVFTADSGLGTTLWEYGALATSQVWNTPANYEFFLSP